MDVIEIVRSWLRDNKYDGLYSAGECACLVNDLAPCGELHDDCEAGYRVNCTPGSEHDWLIQKKKPAHVED